MLRNRLLIICSLVAIHGLNGHAFHTWTHRKSEVMWLRDLLPELVPNIRIMTYGYNARFLNFAAQQDLRNVTMKLLTELVDLRQSEQVLIGISLKAGADDDGFRKNVVLLSLSATVLEVLWLKRH